MNDRVFYHGGVDSNFALEKLDIIRPSKKQQNKNNSYVGFYMYGEENKHAAILYAKQLNNPEKGIIKLTLDENLKTFEVPLFSITRITKQQV